MVSDTGRMTSLEITELNPILDVKNQSGEVAVDLILSAFGKSILYGSGLRLRRASAGCVRASGTHSPSA
jgi:hypothetical protein